MEPSELARIDGVEIVELRPVRDGRGWLLKAVMARDLGKGHPFGESYVSTSVGGAVRGNHVHRRTTEWFVPIGGSGELVLRATDSGRCQVVTLNAEHPVRVRVPVGV